MAEERTCPECAAELPANAPHGLCPRCLVSMGLRLGDESPLSFSSAPNTPRAGERLRYFGDYELLKEIARGGMGIVYKARQVSLNRIVAVKVLLFGKFSSDTFVKRFHTEAEAAASLRHANIVAIHEVGEHEGQHYFSMDYIEGRSLAEVIRDQPLPAREAAEYLKTVAEAIHYAHQRAVLHRDLKPSNVIIALDGQPHVTDFGLAKRLEADSELTLSGQLLGSPNYMPPEQADHTRGQISAASDVYSLGAVLYHLLTGQPPFVAQTLEDTLLQLLNADAVAPDLLNPSVPRDLKTICLKCLNKDPLRRYHSADLLAEDLGRWLRDEPILARPAGKMEKVLRWRRRHPGVASLVATILLLVTLIAVVSIVPAFRINAARREVKRSEQEAKATFLNDLAFGRRGKGHPEEAEPLFRESLAITRKAVGHDNADSARTLYNLGDVCERLDKLPEAESAYRESLAIRRRLMGDEHRDVIVTCEKIGEVLRRQSKLDEADQFYTELLTPEAETRPHGISLLDNRAKSRARQGRWQETKADMLKVLHFQPNQYTPYHTLAPLFVACNDLEGYRQLCRQATVRFADAKAPVICERMAKACLILPDPGLDFTIISHWADVAV
ncbi:MAG TPA: serine/threonine-protein kinase, partial [Verrucomicrobiae bacterium]|nr:serine/threonine-protein kinase [Verrucomicrobiae bacterium]